MGAPIKSQKAKISKWLAEIGDFDFETILKPSKSMVISDCLSRNLGEEITIKMIKASEMSNLQEMDPQLRKIANFTKIDRWPNFPDAEISEFLKWREKIVIGKNNEIGVNLPHFRAIPPKALLKDILLEYHDNSGHPGISQTLEDIERKYFHPEMRKIVQGHIKTCLPCQISKPNNNPIKAPLGRVDPPGQPFEKFAIDLVGPLPMTDDYNRFICVSTDLFSKRVYAQPLTEKAAPQVLKAAQLDWYRNPHLPKSVLMDNGTEFSGLRDFCSTAGIDVKLSPAYHPQTNGEVENRNRTVKSRLRLLCDMENWDLHLPRIIHQINSATHSVTKFSPFQIETGFAGENLGDPYKSDQIKKECDFSIIRERILDNHKSRQKDEEVNHDFKEGDLVLAKTTTLFKKGEKYNGPFKIIKIRKQNLSFLLLNLETGLETTRHLSQIKRFYERENQPAPLQEKTNQILTKQKKKRRQRFHVEVPSDLDRKEEEPQNHAIQPELQTQEENLAENSDEFLTPNLTEESSISDFSSSSEEEQTENEARIAPSNKKRKVDFSSSSEEEEIAAITTNTQDIPESTIQPRKSVSPVFHRICDLTDQALNDIIEKCKIPIKIPLIKTQSKKLYKIEQINEWIRKNKPTWEKDGEGFFLAKFESLRIEKRTYLQMLTIAQITVFAKQLGIKIQLNGKSREEIIAEISTIVKKRFPKFKFTPSGSLIIDPENFE